MDANATVAIAPAWTAEEEFTIAQAESCRQALLDRLSACGDGQPFGTLDLGAVTRIDTAAVQILLALRRTLAGGGQALRIHPASAAVHDALGLYGLVGLLGTHA